MSDDPSEPPVYVRRPRYLGRHPRAFAEKYKELDAARYPAEVEKIRASGKTPAGMHVPILVAELLEQARPGPGETAVDCTLGGGGHARAILERIQPGGRLIGLDVDSVELPRTEARLRAEGFGPEVFVARRGTFAGLSQILAAEGVDRVDLLIADLGVSSMQLDNGARGFSYKGVSARSICAWTGHVVGRPRRSWPTPGPADLAEILRENADADRTPTGLRRSSRPSLC